MTALAPQLAGLRLAAAVKGATAEQREGLTTIDEEATATRRIRPRIESGGSRARTSGQLIDDATVACDIGSHYIYMARHFRGYRPRRLMFSNGQQTLGVALPWAIAAALVRPGTQMVSVLR